MNRYDKLDSFLSDEGYDAYLHIDDSEDSNLYYLSGFDAPDPFTLLRHGGRTSLLVSVLEYGRAHKESRADEIVNTNDYLTGDIRGDPEARFEVLDSFLSERGVGRLGVPRDFSLYTAERLRERGYTVEAIDDVVSETRAVKSEDEVEKVRTAQKANEEAMAVAESVLSDAERDGDVLRYDGDILTAERVKTEIEIALLRRRCSLDQTIVACGEKGADPHWRGEGPLRPDEPVIVDIFPRHESKYHADMTRTFVRGEADERVRGMYEATVEAQEAAFDVLEAGVTGEEVHDAVCDSYEDAGYATAREGAETGFIHSTGHGVGLDVHEEPTLSAGGDELEAGNVVTVEPGLYDPEVGGVRVEDLVVVRDDGYDNLTEYDTTLEL